MAACSPTQPADDIDALAREYVELGLAYAAIEPDALDFYYGPEELRPDPDAPVSDAGTIVTLLDLLAEQVTGLPPSERSAHLAAKIARLQAMLAATQGADDTTFAEQARQLYGIELAPPDETRLLAARETLEELLPGNGDLALRLRAFGEGFIVPEGQRRAVFERALEECRERTAAFWSLPADEELRVEWTDDVPAAWHRYQGEGGSVLQVNPLAVADIGSALDIACHEGFPGHHAQFLQADAGEATAIEDTIVFTRSPEQVLREGAAQFGVDLALPEAGRVDFMRDVLFPLAGFDPAEAERHVRVHAAQQVLAAATAPILADYLDGEMTAFDAGYALETEALVPSGQALLAFARQYGAYVLGYSVARDAVEACVTARAGGEGGNPEARWNALGEIVATTDLASLRGAACGP